MSEPVPGPTFLHKYFAPENRLAEVICGLIMVLTFTTTTSSTFEGVTPHSLLIAVLGCNLAWGIVDAVTYVLGNLLTRGARARLILAVQQAPDDPKVAAVVAGRVQRTLGDLLSPEQCEQVHRWILERAPRMVPEKTRIRKDDLLTAMVCFLIVFGAAIPAVVPFALLKSDALALRVSNGIILAMLFAIGWRWAAFANMSRLKTGAALLALGGLLVIITVVLGG